MLKPLVVEGGLLDILDLFELFEYSTILEYCTHIVLFSLNIELMSLIAILCCCPTVPKDDLFRSIILSRQWL